MSMQSVGGLDCSKVDECEMPETVVMMEDRLGESASGEPRSQQATLWRRPIWEAQAPKLRLAFHAHVAREQRMELRQISPTPEPRSTCP